MVKGQSTVCCLLGYSLAYTQNTVLFLFQVLFVYFFGLFCVVSAYRRAGYFRGV